MIIQVVQDNDKHSGSVLADHDNTGLVLTSNDQSSIVQAGNGHTGCTDFTSHTGRILTSNKYTSGNGHTCTIPTSNGDTMRQFNYQNSNPMIEDYVNTRAD